MWGSEPGRIRGEGPSCWDVRASYFFLPAVGYRGGALPGDERPWSWSALAGAGLWKLVAGPRQALSSEKMGPSHSAVLLSPGTLKVQASRFNFLGRRHSSKKEQNAARSLVTALWMLS